MAKYNKEIQEKCVKMIKEGKTLLEVSKTLGPNKSAIKRYCLKANVEIPKKTLVKTPLIKAK